MRKGLGEPGPQRLPLTLVFWCVGITDLLYLVALSRGRIGAGEGVMSVCKDTPGFC